MVRISGGFMAGSKPLRFVPTSRARLRLEIYANSKNLVHAKLATLLPMNSPRLKTAIVTIQGGPGNWVISGKHAELLRAHGLNLDENVFDFYNRVDKFLSRYLHAEAAPGS